MADSAKALGDDSQRDPPSSDQYEWVHDSTSQRSLIRRHTMKTSWRKRSQINSAQKVNKHAARELRPLLLGPNGDQVESLRSVERPVKAQRKGSHKRHAEVKKEREAVPPGAQEYMQPAEHEARQLAVRTAGMLPRAAWGRSSAHLPPRISGTDRCAAPITLSPSVYFVDPFNTAPIELGPVDQNLLHWWLGTYSNLMFGESSRPGETPPIKEIDGGTFHVPGAFHAGLAYMAMHKSALTGEDWTLVSMHHKTKALNLVNKQFDSAESATSDAAVYSVIRLLTLEDWWGSRQVYNVHLNGLEKMMRMRGGIESLKSNLDLESSYLGLRLCGRPRWFDPPVASPHSQSPHPDLPQASTLWENRQDLFNSCRYFAHFFSTVQNLHLATLNQDCRPTPTSHPHICEVIAIIRSPLNQDANISPPYESHVGETISVVLLFYLALVWRDHALSTQPEVDLLRELEIGLKKSAHRWRTAFGMLIFSMHKIDRHGLGHKQRFYEVLGLMDVARYLPWNAWLRVRSVMQDVLLGEKSNNSTWTELTELSLVEAVVC